MSAYFATVFRLARSTRAASDLERPAASIDRISFTVPGGAVISPPVLPGWARQSDRPGKPYGEGRAPGPSGAALLLKLLIFSCSRCSFPSDRSDHFLANINSVEHVDALVVVDAPLPQLPGHLQGASGVEQDGAVAGRCSGCCAHGTGYLLTQWLTSPSLAFDFSCRVVGAPRASRCDGRPPSWRTP